MSHASDSTKAWVSAVPKKNADGNVIEWRVQYKYTKGDHSHTFDKTEKIDDQQQGEGGGSGGVFTGYQEKEPVTELTGFFDVITSRAEARIKKEKMKNKIEANICI